MEVTIFFGTALLFIIICKAIQLIFTAFKEMLINMLIKRKPLLRRIRSSEIKKGSCYRCNSEKIVSGRLGDGNTKLNFYPYFDPGHYKWYNEWIFLSCPGVDTETEAKCCTECGLLWTKLRIQWLKHFIIHQCKDVFVTEIYGEKNHSECVDSSQNSIIKTDNEAYCLNCNSKIFITGRLFLYIKHWKRGEVRSVSYSLFFHPNHLKEYKFMLRRGVRVNVNSVCCPECGYIFTDINHEKLKLFLKNNCRKAAASFDIVQKQAGVFL